MDLLFFCVLVDIWLMDYGFETGFWSLLFPLMGGYSRNYHSEWYCRWRQTWNLCKDYFEKTSVQYWLGWFKYWHSKKDEFWFNGDGKSSIFPNYRTCAWTFWVLEILNECIVFLNERIYISALYRRHKCVIQVKCSTSISVLYK